MSDPDWIDLPDDNYLAILGYETQNTIELDSLIRKYNQIPKDQIETLSCRIRKLDKIVEKITEWIEIHLEPIDKKKHLLWISEIANKKKKYLVRILHIYENALHEAEAQKTYHEDFLAQRDLSKTPIILNNHRFFSLKMREYWGDFWFESLDPCHRRLTPFLDQWKALKKKDPAMPHFFLWLEGQHIPKYVPRVKHLTGDDLERARVIIKDGLFWERADSEWALANCNTSSKRYLFSIDLEEKIYVAEEGNGISHSSFTCGKPVLGAGLLQISQGQLTSLALESGHYMPSMQIGHQILTIFAEQGALFPKTLEVVFFFDRNKYTVKCAVDPLPSLEQFKKTLESSCTLKQGVCHETSAV